MSEQINQGMTPSSGIGFSEADAFHGKFSIGVEAFFETTSVPGYANIARYFAKMPEGAAQLWVKQGSIAAHPPKPKVSMWNTQIYKTDFLFRIYAGNVGTDGAAYNLFSQPLFSCILKSSWGPVNLPVGCFMVDWPLEYAWMCVHFEQAGESAPSNMEMQITGSYIR